MCALFEKEGKSWFDVRPAILGHVQQGGNPTPFDRIQATRLAARCIEFLIQEAGRPAPAASAIGVQAGKVGFTSLADLALLIDPVYQRPVEQWWMRLKPLAETLSQPTPEETAKKARSAKP
jgi:6-phosphofructokinase 1